MARGISTVQLATLVTIVHVHTAQESTVYKTRLLAHALIGSIAELYTLIFENAPIMQSFRAPPSNRMSL